MKTYTPKKIISYLSKEFLISLFIFLVIFFSLILIISFIEEIIFFKQKDINNNFIIKVFILTLIKIPTLLIQFCPFIFLFTGIFFFAKLNKNKEITSISLTGLSNNFVILVPSIVSFLIGIFIITSLTPATSTLSKYYENIKKKYTNNDNLIILSDTGLWIREKRDNKIFIIRADRVDTQNFSSLKNVTIYSFDNQNRFLERLDSKNIYIKNKDWSMSNVSKFKSSGKEVVKNFNFKSDIDFKELEYFFTNAGTFSVWNIKNKINEIQNRGYYGEDLIIMFNKYLALPFMLFGMINISSLFTLNTNYNFNNFSKTFIGIVFGIIVYYLNDISIALGKSGKIPIVLSGWFPVLIIMTFSIYGLIRNND